MKDSHRIKNTGNDRLRPVGIFDSGLGGLTVLSEVRKLLPRENVIYFGDSGRAPYGTKSRETVRKYTADDMGFLLSQNVKAIVVACNTAAACSGREYFDTFDVPVVDVIEAGAEAALAVTRNRSIGVIGTQATIRSGIYEKAVKAIDPQAKYTARACPLFVPLVEEGWWDGDIVKAVVRKYLEDIPADVDTLVLGCTHYPFLEKVIREQLPGVRTVNSAKVVAGKLREILLENELLNDSSDDPFVKYYTSDSVEKFASLGGMFLGELGGDVQKIDIETISV